MNEEKPNIIDTLKNIGEDAKKLVEEVLKPKASANGSLTKTELDLIKELVKRAEDAEREANKQAKLDLEKQIEELKGLIQSLDSALATPGLNPSTRQALKDLRSKKRGQLLRLAAKVGMDFAGILTAEKLKEVKDILAEAKKAVATKKKAAAFISTMLNIADISLTIATKVASAAL